MHAALESAWCIGRLGAVQEPKSQLFPKRKAAGRHPSEARGLVQEVTIWMTPGAAVLRSCVEASGPRTCVFRVAGSSRSHSIER